MKCIDSRPSPEGRRRKYRHGEGIVLETIEVPLTVWRALNRQGRGNDRAAAYERRVARDALKIRVQFLVSWHKWKPLAVAHDLNIPVRTVQRWAKEGA